MYYYTTKIIVNHILDPEIEIKDIKKANKEFMERSEVSHVDDSVAGMLKQ